MAKNKLVTGLSIGGELSSGFFSLYGGFSDASNIIQAGNYQASGLVLTAEGLRLSAKAVQEATLFNLDIQKQNELQRLRSISTQFQRVAGNNLAAVANSGFSVKSKSRLIEQTDTANSFERALLATKLNAENERRQLVYQSQLKLINFENQARASEFQAESAKALARAQAAASKRRGIAGILRSTVSAAGLLAAVL